jgi:hypothetical protein
MTYDTSSLWPVRFWCSGFASDVRFCTLSALTFPEPIRSNPKLRAKTCASRLAGAENPSGKTGLNGGVTPDQTVTGCYAKLRQVTVGYGRLRSNLFRRTVTPLQHPLQIPQIVAPCCTQNFSQNHCNTFTFPAELAMRRTNVIPPAATDNGSWTRAHLDSADPGAERHPVANLHGGSVTMRPSTQAVGNPFDGFALFP